jgi:hypothetical protein
MSAQSPAQISGTSSTPSLMQRLRGTLSSNSQQILNQGFPVDPLEPTQPPAVSAPSQPPQPEPVEVEEVVVEEPIAETVPQETETEVETPLDSVASAVPLAVDEMTDTLNPPTAGGGAAKEAPLLSVTVERPAIDQAGGVQYVETEKSHELPPEVESFLQKVEDNIDQVPHEIVLTDQQTGQSLPRVLAQPVVVLPITAKMEEEGKKKNTSHSLRWLVEWSWKLMKVFTGKVVYRQD